MSQIPQPDQNEIDARRYQQALDFYFLGLTFTILALSIQTASFGGPVGTDILELSAWGLLLISGLFGLRRGLWTPNLFYSFGAKPVIQEAIRQCDKRSSDAEEARDTESSQNYDKQTRKNIEKLKLAESIIDNAEKKISMLLEIQKYCFVSGLIALIIARAYQPVWGIVKALQALWS